MEDYNPIRSELYQKRVMVNYSNTKKKKKKNLLISSHNFNIQAPSQHVSQFNMRREHRVIEVIHRVDVDKLEGAPYLESEVLVWASPNDEIPFWKSEFPFSNASSGSLPNIQKDTDLLHIVHMITELALIAKVGGLGDIVTGLGHACLSRGHKVDLMLPFYECIQKQHMNELKLINTYNSYHDENWVPTNAFRGVVSGIPVIFIEPSNHFFKGESIYGGSCNELEAYFFYPCVP